MLPPHVAVTVIRAPFSPCSIEWLRARQRVVVQEEKWGVPTFRNVDDMAKALKSKLLFVVLAVPQTANAAMLSEVVATGIPALGQY